MSFVVSAGIATKRSKVRVKRHNHCMTLAVELWVEETCSRPKGWKPEEDFNDGIRSITQDIAAERSKRGDRLFVCVMGDYTCEWSLDILDTNGESTLPPQ